MGWQHGVAKVAKMLGANVAVQCPFCGNQHVHSRLSLGSKEVVAGCHIGGTFAPRCRSYAIPKR